jgi:choice-of-anchor B domain-containing protein
MHQAHNLVICYGCSNRLAMVVGSPNECSGGLHLIDLTNGLDPHFITCYEEEGYIHDCQCAVYAGPDTAFTGHDICYCAAPITSHNTPDNEVNNLLVIDVTDPHSPTQVGKSIYPLGSYAHQGWLSSDQRLFYMGDERDEVEFGQNMSLLVWDVSVVSNPILVTRWYSNVSAIDHNLFAMPATDFIANASEGADLIFLSSYEAGLIVLETSPTAPGQLQQVASFDVVPGRTSVTLDYGAW